MNFHDQIVRNDGSVAPLPTFTKFFTSQELAEKAENAGTIASWDFGSLIGRTLAERHRQLLAKIQELTDILVSKGAVGYFWMATSREISAMFETAQSGFEPSPPEFWKERLPEIEGQQPIGTCTVQWAGIVEKKWRLYFDKHQRRQCILIGVNDNKDEPYSHYAILNVWNYVV